MRRWRGLALAEQPTVEMIPPVEELPVTPDYADWQTPYAALLTIVDAEADDYEDTKQVIFSWEDEAVYAYCNNYMEFYDLTGTVFTGRYDMEDFAIAFNGPQFYFYGVEE